MLGADGRFETRVVPLVEVDGEIVSSSHIRGLVLAGDVELATRFLGVSVSAARRGRARATSGAASSASRPPTSSPTRPSSCPGHGVYAARADGDCAAVNVGVRPTFGTGRAVLVEAYLLDRDVDLYGQMLKIDFLRPAARRAPVRLGRRAGRADARRQTRELCDSASRGGAPSRPDHLRTIRLC